MISEHWSKQSLINIMEMRSGRRDGKHARQAASNAPWSSLHVDRVSVPSMPSTGRQTGISFRTQRQRLIVKNCANEEIGITAGRPNLCRTLLCWNIKLVFWLFECRIESGGSGISRLSDNSQGSFLFDHREDFEATRNRIV